MYEDIPDPVCGKQVDEQIALHLPEMSMKKQRSWSGHGKAEGQE